MEELLIAVVQFALEFCFDVLVNLPFDWPSKHRDSREPEGRWAPNFLWFCGGCALAGLSLLLVRHTMIPYPQLRIANLLLAPLFSAYLSQIIAHHRTETNEFIVPRNHFWQAFWFTLGLVLIRFIYASHA